MPSIAPGLPVTEGSRRPGHRNELIRRDQATFRMIPAQERLEAGHLVRPEIDDGLVDDLEFLPQQRGAQINLKSSTKLQARFHLRFEKAVAMAPVGLGTMQRNIRILEKTVGALVAAQSDGYPDAGAYYEVVSLDPVWLVDGFDQALCERPSLRRVFAQDLNDPEFVTPNTSHDIAMSDTAAQTAGDDAQQLIADRVSKRVVHVLEVIEVDVVHRDAVATIARLRELFVQQLDKVRPIGEAGEDVVMQIVVDLLRRLLFDGDLVLMLGTFFGHGQQDEGARDRRQQRLGTDHRQPGARGCTVARGPRQHRAQGRAQQENRANREEDEHRRPSRQ